MSVVASVREVPRAGVQIRCPLCREGYAHEIKLRRGRMVHTVGRPRAVGLVLEASRRTCLLMCEGVGYWPCEDWDSECRHIGEPMGFFRFAWLPTRCRNGEVRWLRWLEQHEDGSLTLGSRAH